ncbi:MAG: flagellar biosynthetic protein FliR [Treponemataceae bacterium]
MLQTIVEKSPYFFIIAARSLALIMTSPLLSTQAVRRVVQIALAGYMAFLLLPVAYSDGWNITPFGLPYFFLLVGEVMIGVITGFYISLIFAAFSSAGQFFTYQMGFGASEVYDALAQVENPLMGQYFNLIAMLLFLQVKGFQRLFLGGILRSFQSFNAFALIESRETFLNFLLAGLTELFFDAMMIALPIIGTLFLISLSMGMLSKAAPQMNLLSEGFPITILTAFFLLTILMPSLTDFFIRSFEIAFIKLERLFAQVALTKL